MCRFKIKGDKMINNDEKDLRNLTKRTTTEQQKLLKLFAKLNLSQQKEIINNQRTIFHKLRNLNIKNYDSDIFTLAALIIAIVEFLETINEMKLNVIKFNNQKVHKNLKNQKLLSYWSVVKELKEKEDMSFRDISKFLKKSHKFEISHSLIYKVWIEIEEMEATDEY